MPNVGLDILVEHKSDGKVLPKTMSLPDVRKFEIDKVFGVRQEPALKSGCIGTRYLCMICVQERVIFEVRGVWFVEG